MMADNKHLGANGPKSPQTPPQTSPQTSTRSRDEIARNVQARRERKNAPKAKLDPETVRERTRANAEAHLTAHPGGDDRNAAVPHAAAHDPARKDAAREPVRRDEASRGSGKTARRPDDGDDRGKSSAELEREVEHERNELTRTLDQMRSRVSPDQLMEQALDYARDAGGTEFARNLGRSVRDNPLPVLLVGAGIGWLMMSSRSGPPAARSGSTSDEMLGMRERASGLGAEASDRAGQAVDAASDMASSARNGLHSATDRAASAFDSASETGSAVANRARDTMQQTGDAARSATHHAAEYAHDARAGVQRSISRLAKEQPLVLGAIGIAVGAAIAAMLPPSRIENRLMGPTRDALKGQVKRSVERQYEHARDVVEETAQDVSQEFDERGMSPQSAADAAVGATRKAGEAAREVAEGVKTEVEQPSGTKNTEGSSTSDGNGRSTGATKPGPDNPPGSPGGPSGPRS